MRQPVYRGLWLSFGANLSRGRDVSVLPLVDTVLVIALVIDLFAWFFIWKGILPGSVKSVTQIMVGVAVAFAFTQMVLLNRIPVAMWAVVAVSAVGMTVALFRGQGVGATFWGWWNVFKYPMVGVYAYLRPSWPDDFPQKLVKICLVIVGFEVVFQIGQYLAGEPIGDNLAGTFGWHGVGHVLFLTAFTLALALGLWIAQRKWLPVLLALVFGIAANVLAENKLFPATVLLLAVLVIALLVTRGGQLWRLLVFAFLLGVGVLLFSAGYNSFVPGADRRPLQQVFFQEDTRTYYLTKVHRSTTAERQTYNLGRNVAVEYALSTIREDAVTLWFGFGLGARSESEALGLTGAALKRDSFDRGSQLVIMLQELGLFGLAVIGGYTLWVSARLFRDIARYPQSRAVGLRYGLLLFSLLWPLWLWYKNPLGARVAMMFYWVALGYVMSESHAHQLDGQL